MQYGDPLRVIYGKNEENEAERVVAEIIRERFLDNTRYGDYAILYRGNHQSRLFEKALMNNRIPYKITGGQSFFCARGNQRYSGLLAFSGEPRRRQCVFLRIVNTPRRGIGPQTMERIGEFAHQEKLSLFAAALHPGLKNDFGHPCLPRLTTVLSADSTCGARV